MLNEWCGAFLRLIRDIGPLTSDGAITFLAALIALWTVERQIRVSREQVERQLTKEKEDQRLRLLSQKKAILRALRTEIKRVSEFLSANMYPAVHQFGEPGFVLPKAVPFLDEASLAVFRSNAAHLGKCEEATAEAVVDFYIYASSSFSLARSYLVVLQGCGSGPILPSNPVYETLNKLQAAIAIANNAATAADKELQKEQNALDKSAEAA